MAHSYFQVCFRPNLFPAIKEEWKIIRQITSSVIVQLFADQNIWELLHLGFYIALKEKTRSIQLTAFDWKQTITKLPKFCYP